MPQHTCNMKHPGPWSLSHPWGHNRRSLGHDSSGVDTKPLISTTLRHGMLLGLRPFRHNDGLCIIETIWPLETPLPMWEGWGYLYPVRWAGPGHGSDVGSEPTVHVPLPTYVSTWGWVRSIPKLSFMSVQKVMCFSLYYMKHGELFANPLNAMHTYKLHPCHADRVSLTLPWLWDVVGYSGLDL